MQTQCRGINLVVDPQLQSAEEYPLASRKSLRSERNSSAGVSQAETAMRGESLQDNQSVISKADDTQQARKTS